VHSWIEHLPKISSFVSCGLSPVSSFETSKKRTLHANFFLVDGDKVFYVFRQPVLWIRNRIILVTWTRIPHQIKIRIRIKIYKLDPEPDPHHFADVKQKCLEYEPILEFFKGLSFFLS
jgi:hypothetical protein